MNNFETEEEGIDEAVAGLYAVTDNELVQVKKTLQILTEGLIDEKPAVASQGENHDFS